MSKKTTEKSEESVVGVEAAPAGENRAADAATVATEAVEPKELTTDQIADLLEQAAKAEENWNKFVRATADLENFRKRAARERQDAIRYANEALLEKLIPVVDNFEAALAVVNTAEGARVESLKTGINLIGAQLRGVLKEAGLEEVDATGQAFDPALHEAVSQQETADVPEGHVVQQLRKGYKLKDRLIRAATVIVAKKPAA